MNGGHVVIVSRGCIVSASPLSGGAIIGDQIIDRKFSFGLQHLRAPAEDSGVFRVIESDDRSQTPLAIVIDNSDV